MEADLEPPNSTANHHSLSPPSPSPSDGGDDFHEYAEGSNCSTPFVSAPSSPGRSFHYPAGVGFFYSAPASPMHYVLASAPARSSAALTPSASDASSNGSFEFEFSARFDSPAPEIGLSMSSADELFLNGQIRPMKLSAHLQRPQTLAPLLDLAGECDRSENDDVMFQRSSRDLRLRDRSLRRRTRSLSPLRSTAPFDWYDDGVSTPKKETAEERENRSGGDRKEAETTPSGSASSSRCSSAGRSSKRWVFLKDFLRSKSEGRSNNKFWQNISFSPAKEKKEREGERRKKASPAGGKRRSAHEMHYTANRAQAEEMRKKTFLPYRQGLLGCLGFSSKSYGALNGFARALNPVSSR